MFTFIPSMQAYSNMKHISVILTSMWIGQELPFVLIPLSL